MSSSSYIPQNVSSEEHRRSSVMSTKSMKNGLKTLAQKYKEHDRNVQNAWEAYYGAGIYATKPATTRNNSSASEESVRSESSPAAPSSFKKAVKAVKQHAKEHHASVNAAYATYYGDARVVQQRSGEIKAFNRAY
jgi:hypothetical protein